MLKRISASATIGLNILLFVLLGISHASPEDRINVSNAAADDRDGRKLVERKSVMNPIAVSNMLPKGLEV